VDVESLGLATAESVRDDLKLLAHRVQVISAFLQAASSQVVRADLVAKEGGELFVPPEGSVLPVCAVDAINSAQLAVKLLGQTNAEDLTSQLTRALENLVDGKVPLKMNWGSTRFG